MRIAYLVCLLLAAGPAGAETAIDYGPLTNVLSRFVDEKGYVDYGGLKANRDVLDAFADTISSVSPESAPGRFPDRNSRLAFWINAYNVLTLQGVLNAYPVASVKDIKILSGFFNRTWYTVGGRSYTLNAIEHDIIRDRFGDPRIHAAINCASAGCPKLGREAFVAERLDHQLDEAMRSFLSESRNMRIDHVKRRVHLSKILDWFESDFLDWLRETRGIDDANLLDYVSLYASEPLLADLVRASEYRVVFDSYDWALNDQARQPQN